MSNQHNKPEPKREELPDGKKRDREDYIRMLRSLPPGIWRELPPMVSVPSEAGSTSPPPAPEPDNGTGH